MTEDEWISFPFEQIYIPIMACVLLLFCCSILFRGCCKKVAAQTSSSENAAVYVIPLQQDDSPLNTPFPTYDFSSPPPYDEVAMKPYMFPFPEGPPPPYSEDGPPQSPVLQLRRTSNL
nr:PREDICTED: transmembrane protein 92-like [Lepisosteus oculatus]